jgi:two-component system, NtrC family, sensor kinase
MNKIQLLLTCVFLTFASHVDAQKTLPKTFEITKDTSFWRLDTTHFQLLEDTDSHYTLRDVLRPPLSNQFYHDIPYNNERRASTYWVRFRIKNRLNKDLKLFLLGDYSFFTAYLQDSTQKWVVKKTGRLLKRSELDTSSGSHERYRVFFELKINQELLVYQQLKSAFWQLRPVYIRPYLSTQTQRVQLYFDEYKTKQRWEEFFFAGLMLGVLLLAAFYNLFIFFSIRDRLYLYFGICLLFFAFDRQEHFISLAFFEEYAEGFSFCYNFFFILFFFFFIHSLRLFINAKQIPKWNNTVSFFLFLTVVLSIIKMFTFSLLSNSDFFTFDLIVDIFIRCTYIPLLIINVLMVRQKNQYARYLLIATVPLFVFWLFTLIAQFLSVFEINFEVPIYVYENQRLIENFCFTWMIVFFMGALVVRFNAYKKRIAEQALEKEHLEKEREIEKQQILATQNETLERQVAERTAELKASQAQLIQSEKLASLGELTAGIAHEIQNPLNFVNNFSELSVDLAKELKEEIEKPEIDKEYVKELMGDLSTNQEKINHHGKRASSIVKGMLEHSRMSTGVKELTDINKLADEYLRLSYHGLRAKDKNFNSDFKTDFDENMPKIEVIPQDIGRVLLNLINNAFYAVHQRKQQPSKGLKTSEGYAPTVTLSTKNLDNQIIINIKDNGTGMPESVRAKIFQPFFTTKPTGEGTGLGLSLAYDIITKGHGGTIEVESVEGEGTTFVVKLPIA